MIDIFYYIFLKPKIFEQFFIQKYIYQSLIQKLKNNLKHNDQQYSLKQT